MTDDPDERESNFRGLVLDLRHDVEFRFVGDRFLVLTCPGKRPLTLNLMAPAEHVIKTTQEWGK